MVVWLVRCWDHVCLWWKCSGATFCLNHLLPRKTRLQKLYLEADIYKDIQMAKNSEMEKNRRCAQNLQKSVELKPGQICGWIRSDQSFFCRFQQEETLCSDVYNNGRGFPGAVKGVSENNQWTTTWPCQLFTFKWSMLRSLLVVTTWETVRPRITETHTNDSCCECLQQWDEDPIEEKQTELERYDQM